MGYDGLPGESCDPETGGLFIVPSSWAGSVIASDAVSILAAKDEDEGDNKRRRP